MMRVAIAGFNLESVSFLPHLTTLEDFRRAETSGSETVESLRGTNTVIGGFIDVCEREGIAMVPIVDTEGGAAGPAPEEAFEHYSGRIVEGLRAERGHPDGVLLPLTAALTTPKRVKNGKATIRD